MNYPLCLLSFLRVNLFWLRPSGCGSVGKIVINQLHSDELNVKPISIRRGG